MRKPVPQSPPAAKAYPGCASRKAALRSHASALNREITPKGRSKPCVRAVSVPLLLTHPTYKMY